jgi:hypothetical protein
MNEPTQTIFDLVLARPIDRPGGEDGLLVHLWWRAPHQGERLVQVYVNDRLYDISLWSEQRAMWLMLDRRRPHRIELLGVSIDDARGVWTPQPEHLQGWSPAVHDIGEVELIRDHTLPVDTWLKVEVDSQVMDEAAVWPADVSRSGFGAVFGEGGFGIDAATGPGLGLGELGRGPLGSDGDAWRWRHAGLSEGEHSLAVRAEDPRGRAVASPLNSTLTIERLPKPGRNVHVDADFTLSWQ